MPSRITELAIALTFGYFAIFALVIFALA